MTDQPETATYNTSREIEAPCTAVFAAISEPERLARWWGPEGFTNTFDVCEFEEGGDWIFTMHSPNGQDYKNENTFVEIDPPRKVVIRHRHTPKFTLTIALSPSDDGGTVVAWSQTFDSPDVAKEIEHIVVPANEQNLQRLAAEVLTGPDRYRPELTPKAE